MSTEPQLFKFDASNRQSAKIAEVDFGTLGLLERQHIQEWVAANPSVLGEGLLIVGKEFSGFDRTNERVDLIAVDATGRLVVIELKRDDTGADAHWQAIKYAGYLHRATSDSIVRMTAAYRNETEEEAGLRLVEHLGADDLSGLNHDQCIILASHRFAPEVTSAALWLNEKGLEDDLFTCVKLTPYQDTETGALYIQASTIIPVPGLDEGCLVGVGQSSQREAGKRSSFGANLKKAFDRNRNDAVTHFLRSVGQAVTQGLAPAIRPDRTSRWSGAYLARRYYHLWYQRQPWGNQTVSYRIILYPRDEEGYWQAQVVFAWWEGIEDLLDGVIIHPEQRLQTNQIYVVIGTDTLNDDFGSRIVETMRSFIEHITPAVEEAVGSHNGEGIESSHTIPENRGR